MTSLAEQVARLALSQFEALPQKCKPRTLADGGTEWTPMAAVILVQGKILLILSPSAANHNLTAQRSQYTRFDLCFVGVSLPGTPDLAAPAHPALRTGTKCLPASAMPKCQGSVLHDSHAEVLALRGFNHWLLAEIKTILENPTYISPFLESSTQAVSQIRQDRATTVPPAPFRVKENVLIYFFTTEAPCGDASMEILMRCFAPETAAPWPADNTLGTALQGRGHFSLLGHVRRKPSRADAEASCSKSCTDKLAVKQFTSTLAFPADLFIQQTHNAYIQAVVVFADKYDDTGYQRAFGPSGRLSAMTNVAHFFSVGQLPRDFERFPFEQRNSSSGIIDQTKSKASNLSLLWAKRPAFAQEDKLEILINGVKQGYKQWDSREGKASFACRRRLWALGAEVSGLMFKNAGHSTGLNVLTQPYSYEGAMAVRHALSADSYKEAKSSKLRLPIRERRDSVTSTLGNWKKNTGDDSWGQD